MPIPLIRHLAQPTQRVAHQPTPRLRDVIPPTRQVGDYLERPGWLHCLGRDALSGAFRALSLPGGTIAWMPSFHCGVEVQAALDAGLAVDFYPVRADSNVDYAELEARVRARPGPVLLIHYFGQGQPAT